LKFQKDYIEERGYPHFPGVLTACQIGGEPTLYLIDGQHRYKAMLQLVDSRISSDFPVILQIIRVRDEEEIHREFVNINKSVPVPVNILNPDKIVSLVMNLLTAKYELGFSECEKMTRPRIPIDKFKDYLMENGVVGEKGITSGAELFAYLVRTNEILHDLGISKLQRMLAKRNKVERAWIARWHRLFEDGKHMYAGMFRPDRWGLWVDILMNINPEEIRVDISEEGSM